MSTVNDPIEAFAAVDRAGVVAGLRTARPAEQGRAERGHARFAVPVDRHAPAAARRQVAGSLRANAVAPGVQSDIDLLVSEVVTNVVRHQRSRTVDIEVTVDADRAVTVVVTGGAGAPSVPLLHPTGRPGPSSAVGRGLIVLDSLASAWGTRREDRQTAVWFTVRETGANPGAGVSGRAASAAQAVIAEAVAIAADTEAQLTAEPGVVAAQAALTAEQAAVDAATKAADAAHSARAARAHAATLAAQAVARTAAQTVDAVQFHADELAQEVATAASRAAATVSGSAAPGDVEAARAALRMGATVSTAAAVKATETADAALIVARAVAAAAAEVAATTAAEAAAVEHEVLDAALAVRAVTAAAAQQLATDTVERGAAVAIASREAAAAATLLREDNAQLQRTGRYDRAVALALQEAMLTQLPASDGLQLAARYLTAAEQDQVGGDWYDAVVLPTGSTAFVIGDVIGHDIAAAAMMGQLRNMLRALIWDRDEPPSAIVARLDRAIRDLRVNTMATLLVASVEPPSAREHTGVSTVRWTNAGHPAPIVIHSDGTVLALEDTTDVLLGVRPDTARRDHSYGVPSGATMLLYTDGLIETIAQDLDTGQRRLLESLRVHHRLDPGPLLDAVLADLVADQPTDDVAVLAVRFHAESDQAPSPGAGGPVGVP